MTNKEKADLFCHEWLSGKTTFTITTSGSTGTPKTIELRRGQMIASAKKTINALGLREGMTSLVCLDVNFIAGKMMLVRSMLAGMKMTIVEPVANPLSELPSLKLDFTALVPYQLGAILSSSARSRLNDVGRIILGGASIGSELLREIKKIDTPVYATFGMTETLSHIALQKLNGRDAQDFFEVLDDIEISVDERQCLVIKADYLDDAVTTNDIVELINKKCFRWLGRWDNVINTGGVKVMPEKVEQAIGDLLANNRYFVASLAHEQLGQQVVLVVEGMLSLEEEMKVLNKLKSVLLKYEVPKQVLYCSEFATTQTQKVNRAASLKNALPRPSR
jgi:O-succinylbenzoic acid--CoA ligase